MKYYLLDENKNLVEGFDKEGFLALLEQAIEQGSLEDIDEDSAVASKIRSVLNGTTHHIEFVTQAQYNQLVADEELVVNTYYFITDDTTAEDLEEVVERNTTDINELKNRTADLEELTEQLEDYSLTYQGYGEPLQTYLELARQFYLANANDEIALKRNCVCREVYPLKISFLQFYYSQSGISLRWELTANGNLTSGFAMYSGSAWTIYYDNETSFTKNTWTSIALGSSGEVVLRPSTDTLFVVLKGVGNNALYRVNFGVVPIFRETLSSNLYTINTSVEGSSNANPNYRYRLDIIYDYEGNTTLKVYEYNGTSWSLLTGESKYIMYKQIR